MQAMALGRQQRERQEEFWVPRGELPKSAGHPFYGQAGRASGRGGLRRVRRRPLRAVLRRERPAVDPAGRYFRMLFVGYFEGIGSQRGIAWRCGDSLSLAGLSRAGAGRVVAGPFEPDADSAAAAAGGDDEVFRFVLTLAEREGAAARPTVGVDATTLEANAAMKSIVRKDTGEDWKEYLRRLAEEEGIEDPTDEELRRFDKKRKNKKVSNEEWESPTDPDSRIAKMKDGRTHLAYKAEHVVDLDTDLVVAAEVYTADQGDPETLPESLDQAQENIDRCRRRDGHRGGRGRQGLPQD